MILRLRTIRVSFLRLSPFIRLLTGLVLLIASFPIISPSLSTASSLNDESAAGDHAPVSPNGNDPVVARTLYPQNLLFDENGHVTTPIVTRSYDLDVSRIYSTKPTSTAITNKLIASKALITFDITRDIPDHLHILDCAKIELQTFNTHALGNSIGPNPVKDNSGSIVGWRYSAEIETEWIDLPILNLPQIGSNSIPKAGENNHSSLPDPSSIKQSE